MSRQRSGHKTRLLAPAGSMEALQAAVYSGADAVYAGGQGFNARSFAANFSPQQLKEAVAFCHLYGVEFYQTLNILVSDREREDFLKQAAYANEIGVDGVIVQDLGMVKSIRECFPDLRISGSTQMSVCNLDGVLLAAQLGMSRVVLARELPLSEIAYICSNSPIEVETFVHGALCMCYSGQCYMSAMIGQRSGNRGQCAQPCRLPYTGTGGKKGYPLSLKDLCGAQQVDALQDAGVDVLKIEGRMKRSEYVAVVSGVYQRLLRQRGGPTPEEMQRLTTIFSRGGFTDGYLTGHTGRGMFGTRTENESTAEFQQLVRETAAHTNAKEAVRRVPLDFCISLHVGQPLLLTATDDRGNRVQVQGEPPQPAISRAVELETVRRQLDKLGGTPYCLGRVDGELEPGLRVPMSAINALRREAVQQMSALRSAPPQRRVRPQEPVPPAPADKAAPNFSVQLADAGLLTPKLGQYPLVRIYVPLEGIESHGTQVQACVQQGLPLVPVLPRIFFDGERAQVVQLLEQWKALGAQEALCGNLGHLRLLREVGLCARGDFSLNIYNSLTSYVYAQLGLIGFTPDFEMRRAQMAHLQKYGECEAIVYGKVPVMLTQNCVVEGSCKHCGKCRSHQYLTDRKGEKFQVCRAFGCRNELYNPHPIYLADQLEPYRHMGLHTLRLCFTDESEQQMLSILRDYQAGGGTPPPSFTRGLYDRGVY